MKNFDFASKKLMTPGPVPLSSEVKKAFAEWECHHRTEEFTEILNLVFAHLKKVFQTEQHCFLQASTGTGALEAAFVNTVRKQDKILSLSAGKFGQRWGKIAQAYSVQHQEMSLPWGKDIDLNFIDDELKKGSYQALAFQACETSSGALLPVKELCEICQDHGVLSIVDGITALGALHLPMDEWGIDVLIGGSQKAFMLPTGLSFLSLSKRAEEVQADLPRFYFDLETEKKSNLSGKTRWSTPTHFVLALYQVLDQMVNQVGLDKHFQEIHDKADFFREKVNLDLFPETSSPSLSCLKVPEGVSGNKIKADVARQGYIIMGGQDQLADKVLRVGHMGQISKDELLLTAEAINQSL